MPLDIKLMRAARDLEMDCLRKMEVWPEKLAKATFKARGGMVRVYARKGGRHDKRFSFANRASLNEAWKKACNVIVNDPRAVL